MPKHIQYLYASNPFDKGIYVDICIYLCICMGMYVYVYMHVYI
jgi:hypothetical protein